jgi:hypothetical protein
VGMGTNRGLNGAGSITGSTRISHFQSIQSETGVHSATCKSRGSSVGIATCYGLDGPISISNNRRFFSSTQHQD